MKIAVLLCSMGGPSCPKEVRPFLFRLFNDPAIFRIGQPWRFLLAGIVSLIRSVKTRAIYRKIGGGSPILKNTLAQVEALQRVLGADYVCRCAMSYSEPLIDPVVREIAEDRPDHFIVVPMYPHYSTTTTASVERDVRRAVARHGILCPVDVLHGFYDQNGFISALVELTRVACRKAQGWGRPVILFSAHGLPQSVVRQGDPYPVHCVRTVTAVMDKINGADAVLCYQSKIGPVPWIGPSTPEEVRRAALAKRPIVVVPFSFVCEHSETLVELGMTYRSLALEEGAPCYELVPTVGVHPAFISGLAEEIRKLTKTT
ncbi:MAG: ferrochelatase [Bdellovibrionales bacterium]